MPDLRDLLEERAERGEPRGVDVISERAVWEALSNDTRHRRNPLPFLAAAAVVVIALVAGTLVLTRDNHKPKTDTPVATSSDDGWQAMAPAPIAARSHPAAATDGFR